MYDKTIDKDHDNKKKLILWFWWLTMLTQVWRFMVFLNLREWITAFSCTKKDFPNYNSEKLLYSCIPSTISGTKAILWNWASHISEKLFCITGKNETGFPGSNITIQYIVHMKWVALYSLCHKFSQFLCTLFTSILSATLFKKKKICLACEYCYSMWFSMEESGSIESVVE